MDESGELLAEMLLHSAQFCSKAEVLSASLGEKQELDEFRLKLGQARNILERLQVAYSDDALDLGNKQAIGEFRQLVIALLWIAFYIRQQLDFRTFRMVVSIEAGLTYLLVTRP
jgi:hypothetical protein